MIQNQLSSLVRMEGSMIRDKINELSLLFDLAYENEWLFRELFDNYPFPADLVNPLNLPQPGKLAPKTLADHIHDFGKEKIKQMTILERKTFFTKKMTILHGEDI